MLEVMFLNDFGINVLECYHTTFRISENCCVENVVSAHGTRIGHSHGFYQMSFALDEGTSKLFINNIDYPIKKNTIFLMKPNILHSFKISETLNFIELKFYLNNNELEEILSYIPDVIPDEGGLINSILHSILDEFKKSANDSLMFLKVYELILTLKRLSKKNEEIKIISNYSSSLEPDKNRFSELVNYIHTHYMDNITRDRMAKMMCMEPAYFSKTFKKIFYTTPTNYLNRVRLSHALNMLEYTGMSIMQISDALGFNSQNSFCRLFKTKYNMTPLEYRKQVQEGLKERYL